MVLLLGRVQKNSAEMEYLRKDPLRDQLWGWKGKKSSGGSSILSNQPDEGEQANPKLGQFCR